MESIPIRIYSKETPSVTLTIPAGRMLVPSTSFPFSTSLSSPPSKVPSDLAAEERWVSCCDLLVVSPHIGQLCKEWALGHVPGIVLGSSGSMSKYANERVLTGCFIVNSSLMLLHRLC